MFTIDQLLINSLLYIMLPLWVIAGFVDWCCHRATKIETTTGLTESLMHSVMGIQIAIPMYLCLLFEVNVLILLICIVAWALHEIVAHLDIKYAEHRRRIGLWEMQAHSYLATLPTYMILMIGIINWPVVQKLFTLDFSGQMSFIFIDQPHGGENYLPIYMVFMAIVGVAPYVEENIRCLRIALKSPKL
ncbi:hypothetical protein [Saccharophagus degradans]|uniref:Diguanylate cyclase n=2 Tax=Saccharophagus degradans TaxID=86304 RepID=Q21N40_SACD2|nr:hypothetical protein [Saccharophagus degradans]ABD79889.1 conserved hypothetical protein [Saccharophagus degradans 2-40]MBU2983822.1 diguanylate cyclase [Saccharophagus degradans]MDO6422203.1 diguanylate cyclase [Saccharophagus degradans]MDO6607522.1 diguanylate cyclase [Saccharophagus degradans]WGO97947.1 diguanylate cyclase [Saccharophagus degradans]